MTPTGTPTLDPSAIIAHTWRVYRENWRYLVAVAAVVFVPLGLLATALGSLGWPGLAVSTVATLVAVFLVQGALVGATESLRGGRPGHPSVGATLRDGRRWFATLAVASVLAAISVVVGLVLFIVPGLVLLTWWAVLSPVVVIERRGVGDSFRRARALVVGHGWPVFGVAVLTMIIQLAFSLAVGLATSPLGNLAADFVGIAVGNSLAAPFMAVSWTLTYFALRDVTGT